MARDFSHSSSQYIASIDAEIERLQTLRAHVAVAVEAGEATATSAKAGRKGMSADGRRRVAEAQKARWAKQKRAAKSAAKAPGKKTLTRKNATKKTTVPPPAKKASVKTSEQA